MQYTFLFITFLRILQGLNQLLDSVPLDNETGNVTYTLNNFAAVATFSNIKQTFSISDTASSNETISPKQLLVNSEPASHATGSITPQGLDSCNQRIIYSVFRTDALFLTPETACQRFAVGSIILGVRVNDTSSCNNTFVSLDILPIEEVCVLLL